MGGKLIAVGNLDDFEDWMMENNGLTPQPKGYYYRLLLDDTASKGGLMTLAKEVRGFNARTLNVGNPITSWPEDIRFSVYGTLKEDLIVGGYMWFLYSNAFRRTIEEIVPSADVQFLPVEVVHEKMDLGQYWVMNIISELEALDFDHTVWLDRDEKYPSLGIIKYAVIYDEVAEKDLFRLRIGGISNDVPILSKKLQTVLHERDLLKGIILREIKAY